MKIKSGNLFLVWLGLFIVLSCAQAEPATAPNPGDSSLRRDARVEILVGANAGPILLDVEVADEKFEQDRGLMNRRIDGDGEGMLFVYRKAAPRIFWMRDTPVSLDMLFFDSKRRLVALIPNAEPFSEHLLKSHSPAQYVLEVPAGFAQRHAVRLGAEFRFVLKRTN
ncbi:MAG: DUF192 domain-containing protein [Elusimicrobia bacterium]|nr:DUF192 domain-containing protein [Elusimicrobiota bacterium]